MEIVQLYKSMIDVIVERAGSADLLHVHVGMAIYLATLMVIRNRRGGMIALQMVLAAELGNEVMDWLAASPRWTWADTINDFVLTLLWPTAFTAVVAWRRHRWRRSIMAVPQRATIPPGTTRTPPIATT